MSERIGTIAVFIVVQHEVGKDARDLWHTAGIPLPCSKCCFFNSSTEPCVATQLSASGWLPTLLGIAVTISHSECGSDHDHRFDPRQAESVSISRSRGNT